MNIFRSNATSVNVNDVTLETARRLTYRTTMPSMTMRNPIQAVFAVDDTLMDMFVWAADTLPTPKNERSSAWMPAADIYETEETIVVQVELAGIDKNSLQVIFHEGALIVQGDRPFNPEPQPSQIYRIERAYGAFYRAITLPNPVDPQYASASYEQGILTITFTKRTKPVPEKVNIRVTVG